MSDPRELKLNCIMVNRFSDFLGLAKDFALKKFEKELSEAALSGALRALHPSPV